MLKVTNISKTFFKGTSNEKKALNGLSLILNDGDFCTVIGGNGAGKSTLLNAIAGAYIPDAGTIEINGTDVTRVSEYKRAKYIGRVFQDPLKGTAAGMQVEENLLLASRRGESRRLKWAFPQEIMRNTETWWPVWISVWRIASAPASDFFPAASVRRSRCLWRP